MAGMSLWHWMVVLGVVVVLFGAGRIPTLMGDVAKGVKAFKKGLNDEPPPTQDGGVPKNV